MKAVILAGGLGTRLAEETEVEPEADGRDRRKADPLAHHEALRRATGFSEFVVASGYKGECIKDYFLELLSRSTTT